VKISIFREKYLKIGVFCKKYLKILQKRIFYCKNWRFAKISVFAKIGVFAKILKLVFSKNRRFLQKILINWRFCKKWRFCKIWRGFLAKIGMFFAKIRVFCKKNT
jgi:hypothetical protein